MTSMAFKRASTLMGLPDQDRGWEEVQVSTRTAREAVLLRRRKLTVGPLLQAKTFCKW